MSVIHGLLIIAFLVRSYNEVSVFTSHPCDQQGAPLTILLTSVEVQIDNAEIMTI